MFFIFVIVVAVIVSYAWISCSKNESLSLTKGQEFFKPDSKAYLFYGFMTSFLGLIVLFGFLFLGHKTWIVLANHDIPHAISFGVSIDYLWMILSISSVLVYVILSVNYKKEKYFFSTDRLIHQGGGIFSDFSRDLNIKNITHVTMMLPFIENKLFGTGYIKIESAGAETTEIFLRSVNRPQERYEDVINLMKKNGFRLTQEKLIQQEKPHPLAVFFEVMGMFAGFAFFIAYFFLALLDKSNPDLSQVATQYTPLLGAGLGVILLGGVTFCLFSFLDLKKRVYDLYEDTVVYTEGFLNKNYSFIPIENLADSAVTQSFFSRIFGLYDVKISCQGSGQEILFKNMENGEKLSNNIDELIARAKSLVKDNVSEPVFVEGKSTSFPKPGVEKKELDREYRDEFRMAVLRTWMPAILLSPLLIIIFPAGIIVAIGNMIAVACNVFRVKADTIEHAFSFLSKKTIEFSFDKVTGIVLKENFIDKWFGTVSILFWSIGSGEHMIFSNIKNKEQLQERILAKKGIRKQDVLDTLNSRYDLANMIKGNLYLALIFASLILLGIIFFPSYGWWTLLLLALVYAVVFIYRMIYYSHSKIVFYKDYLRFTRGLFFVEEYFVCYDDIKDITTIKFPFSQRGNVRFNVAGELITKTKNGETIVSNSFTIRFVNDINVLDELIDAILYQSSSVHKISEMKKTREDTSSKPEYRTKPCLSNTLVFVVPGVVLLGMAAGATINLLGLMSLSLITYLLLASGAFIIGVVILTINAISYNIQSYRVYERSGVIFKKQTSITFNKMDFINFTQGPINKMFGNGNIIINTTGSRKPELIIKNIKDFKKFYEIVKGGYK